MIFKLENWILDQSFQAAAGWDRAGLDGVRVNVNLSAREFPRADLVARVTQRLRRRPRPRRRGARDHGDEQHARFDEVAEQLHELIAKGIELWLDDFGTGHSSLEWLSHLPLQGVKIPGTFVERLHERCCETIVTRVIDLAHDLELKVIAEGVENAEQRDFLAERGCDYFQGFLFHAALPAKRLPSAVGGVAPPLVDGHRGGGRLLDHDGLRELLLVLLQQLDRVGARGPFSTVVRRPSSLISAMPLHQQRTYSSPSGCTSRTFPERARADSMTSVPPG